MFPDYLAIVRCDQIMKEMSHGDMTLEIRQGEKKKRKYQIEREKKKEEKINEGQGHVPHENDD